MGKKKPTKSKGDAIRQYLSQNPGSSPAEVKDALAAQGHTVSTAYVSLVRKGTKRGGKQAAVDAFIAKNPKADLHAVNHSLSREWGEFVSSQLAVARRRAREKGGISKTGEIGVMDGMIAKLDQEEAKLLERIEGIRQAKRVIQQG